MRHRLVQRAISTRFRHPATPWKAATSQAAILAAPESRFAPNRSASPSSSEFPSAPPTPSGGQSRLRATQIGYIIADYSGGVHLPSRTSTLAFCAFGSGGAAIRFHIVYALLDDSSSIKRKPYPDVIPDPSFGAILSSLSTSLSELKNLNRELRFICLCSRYTTLSSSTRQQSKRILVPSK